MADQPAADEDVRRNISESADKINLEMKVKRGTGTRDQDTIKVKVKGDDPEATVDKLNATVERIRETAQTARDINPEREV
jgi:hypothetical protein